MDGRKNKIRKQLRIYGGKTEANSKRLKARTENRLLNE